MNAWRDLEREVIDRAAERCEYCRMQQSLQGATFHVEHIIPRCRGGPSHLENLALACPTCNLRKADRTTVADPATGQFVALFHPRNDAWHEHFTWDGYELVGLTSTGRAAVLALDLNHPRRILIRQAEELFELWPPREVKS